MSKTLTKKRMKKTTDDYLELVCRFPLRPIGDDAEFDRAIEVYTELAVRVDGAGLSVGESDYVDALGHFISAYEDAHFKINGDLTPVEALKHIMSETGMKTSDLGKLLGSGPGQASLILNGKRSLSKANIRTLAEHFHLSPALFL